MLSIMLIALAWRHGFESFSRDSTGGNAHVRLYVCPENKIKVRPMMMLLLIKNNDTTVCCRPTTKPTHHTTEVHIPVL